jgi:hypothetical protein
MEKKTKQPDAYDRWRELPPSARSGHICDEPSEYCTEWVLDHVRAWMNGEPSAFSWREALRPLIDKIPYMQKLP